MSTQAETLNSFLSFRLDDELFAANVGKVLEILEIPKITKVPRSPEYMRGVVNLRGNVLPVIDTRTKFGLPPTSDTVNSCILVLSIASAGKNITLGAVVDAVQEVMEIDNSAIQAVPSMGTRYKSEFIDGMVKLNDQFIMLLNLDLVFTSEEVFVLEEAAGSKN
ncbi:MAG TPA: chemotaxis protein CheW [Ohtaekwangia sp.]|uniref:chemotaxis protein CheW n=1 Tax=Ohtaekwangia sp. TaxID=2066019 RepID=UPI002F9262B9